MSHLDQLTTEVQLISADTSILEYALNRILEKVPAELADIIRLCAVPHWFTPEIIGVLRDGSAVDHTENNLLFETLAGMAFISQCSDSSRAYHEEVRNLLLEWWRAPENLERYRRISGRLAEYFNRRDDIHTLARDLLGERTSRSRHAAHNLPNVLEAGYHSVLEDAPHGIGQLLDLFWVLDYAREDASGYSLVTLAFEHEQLLDEEARLWLRYLRAHNLVVLSEPRAAQALLKQLLAQTTDSRVRSWVLVDWGQLIAQAGRRDDARIFYEEALKCARRFKDDQAIAYAFGSLGDTYRDDGLLAKAASYYRRALSTHRKHGDKIRETHQIRGLTRLLRRRREWGGTGLRTPVLERAQGEEQQQASALVESGIEYEEKGDWDKALHNYQDALKLLEQQPKSPGVQAAQAKVLYSIGDAQRGARRWKAAEDAYQASLKLAEKELHNPSEQAGRLYDLGQIKADQEYCEEAQAYYRQAYAIFKRLGDSSAQIKVLYSVGRTYRAVEQWEEAKDAYEQSLALAQEQQEARMVAWCLNDLGLLAADQKHWKAALDYYQQALDVFGELSLLSGQATVYYHIGDAERAAKHWKAAEAAYKESLRLAKEEPGDRSEAGWRLYDLGLLSADQENWEQALEYYNLALKRFVELDSRSAQITAWHYIGDAERAARHWEAAEAAYKQSLALASELGDRRREGYRLNDLGLLSVDHQRWDEALAYYRQALAIFKELGLRSARNIVSDNIEYAQRRAQAWQPAGQIYIENWEQARQLADRSREVWRLNGLGLLEHGQERWDEALAYYHQALTFFGELELSAAQLIIWHNIGGARVGAKSWAQAEEAYHQGLVLARKLDDHGWVERFLQGLAAVEQAQKL